MTMGEIQKTLEIAEGYVRAAAFKEVSEPPYEHGQAHKHLEQVHATLAWMQAMSGANGEDATIG